MSSIKQIKAREILDKAKFSETLKISEEVEYEIFLNNNSAAKGTGNSIAENINLKEGRNDVRIVVKDLSGWQSERKFVITSDTQAPQIKDFKVEKGNEYYQGRA